VVKGGKKPEQLKRFFLQRSDTRFQASGLRLVGKNKTRIKESYTLSARTPSALGKSTDPEQTREKKKSEKLTGPSCSPRTYRVYDRRRTRTTKMVGEKQNGHRSPGAKKLMVAICSPSHGSAGILLGLILVRKKKQGKNPRSKARAGKEKQRKGLQTPTAPRGEGKRGKWVGGKTRVEKGQKRWALSP